MIVKSPILINRVRKVPKGFSWVDHRLVRDGYIDALSYAESALYLFLVCVSDKRGLSYYGDQSIMAKLSMDEPTLDKARSGLITNNLLAWQKPIYQVISLEPAEKPRRSGSPMSLGDILKTAMGGET